MLCFRSDVDVEHGRDERLKLKFSQLVMEGIGLGAGKPGSYSVTDRKFQEIIRHGGSSIGYSRSDVEREFIPVDDNWSLPTKNSHRILERGMSQLGSLGGGNHFAELQYDQNGKLWVMVHTGSRGFGHGLASHYIQQGKDYLKKSGVDIRGGAEAVYFEPDNPLYNDYKNAVAAGGNFAIANRLILWEIIGRAFKKVFKQEPELVYEISHNLVQEETVPEIGKRWIHRKGATRAFPAGHPMLKGTKWEKTGHPILIPGSMGDTSYVLYASAGAANSLYSVNHGCGRKHSRMEMKNLITQSGANKQMKELGVLVNAGSNVPIDESPNAYKPSADVIEAVVNAGLATIAYTLNPLASIKGVD
jgi:tRNA-splicing ligase RtcB